MTTRNVPPFHRSNEFNPPHTVARNRNIAWMGSHFRSYHHRAFILFSILPVLAATLARRRGALAAWQGRLQRVDRTLLAAVPWVGRYCWETVVVLEG